MTGPADVIFINAEVVTCAPGQPSAREIAVGKGRVLRLGHDLANDQGLASGARIIDCGGETILPGFIDAHLHFLSYVDTLLSVSLRPSSGIRSISDIQAAIRREAQHLPPGEWIKGKGYNEFYLTEKRHPTRHDLDAAASDHPVKLTHRSRHAHVLNTRALELLGIDRYTPDLPGGLIERDLESGDPNGLLYEMGEFLAQRIPQWEPERFEEAVGLAAHNLASVGITSFVDASVTNNESRRTLLQSYRDKGLIPQRVVMMMGREALRNPGRKVSAGSGRSGATIPVWGMKLVIDRTTGTIRPDRKELVEILSEARTLGWPVAMHAVEEETLEAALEALEAVVADNSSVCAHRIEHGSVCPPRLAARLAALGVTVVTQPSFVYYFGERYLAMVDPEKQPHLYPLGTWLQHGIPMGGSSDCPLVPPSPLMGMYAAATRRAENGELVGADQKIQVEAAVALYTSGAARACGLESAAGSLEPGKSADLVLLSSNPLTTAPDQIKDIEVRLTMTGGKIVWEASGDTPAGAC